MFDLFVSFYSERNLHRISEYAKCFEINAGNEFIRSIHVAYECKAPVALTEIFQTYPFLNRKDIFIHQIIRNASRSISYLDLIKLANAQLSNGGRFIIANTDIYFDDTLKLLDDFDFSNTLLALTRYNVEPYRNIAGGIWQRHFGSQDSWFFQCPVPELHEFDINLGWHGCDSRIAYELDKAGYCVLNASKSIKSWHVHAQTLQQSLEEKYSYRHSGKAYKWLPFFSLEEIFAPDFVYPTLDSVDRNTMEWMLEMYRSELIDGKRHTNATGVLANKAKPGVNLIYSFCGRCLKLIVRASQKTHMGWIIKGFKKMGLFFSKIGYDLQHIDK